MVRVTSSFRDLVERHARRGLKKGDKPRPLASVAKDFGISRPHLYNLMNGDQGASDWVLSRIVKGSGLAERTIKDALRVSLDERKIAPRK